MIFFLKHKIVFQENRPGLGEITLLKSFNVFYQCFLSIHVIQKSDFSEAFSIMIKMFDTKLQVTVKSNVPLLSCLDLNHESNSNSIF